MNKILSSSFYRPVVEGEMPPEESAALLAACGQARKGFLCIFGGMRVLLSFLGTSSYTEAEYDFGSEEDGGAAPRLLRGRFASLCMAQVWKPQEIIILATEKAESQNQNKEQFEREYKEKGLEALPCQLRFQRIPEGRTQEEIWSLFQTIVETIPPESEVVIDVTHGFRSLPMIALAAVHYLELVKRIRIKHIWYGAFEQGREGAFPIIPIIPIIDLAAFSDMLGWIWAVRTFRDSGESHPLAEKLTSLQNGLFQTLSKNPHLQTLSKHLEHIGLSLLAVQPHTLRKRIPLAIETIERVPLKAQEGEKLADLVSPLPQAEGVSAALLDLLRTELQAFQRQSQSRQTDDQEMGDARAQLEFELWLIERYLTWHKPAQALILMREWVISWVLHSRKLPEGILFPKGKEHQAETLRKEVENQLGSNSPPPDPILQKVHPLMSEIRQKRNALAHAGYNSSARIENLIDPQRLRDDLQKILKEMRKLLSEA